jgi:hypothetical protein
LGIFAPLKIKALKVKINISKKLLVRLAIFVALIGAAVTLDAYFEKNPANIDNIQAGDNNQNSGQGEVYVLAQTSSTTVKTSVEKPAPKYQRLAVHDKLLRKHYSIRNYQVLKAEVLQQTTPLINSYHYLVYQTHSLSSDEDPLA